MKRIYLVVLAIFVVFALSACIDITVNSWEPYRDLTTEDFNRYYYLEYTTEQYVDENDSFWYTKYSVEVLVDMAASCQDCTFELLGEVYEIPDGDSLYGDPVMEFEILVKSNVSGDSPAPDIVSLQVENAQGTVEHFPPE